MAQLGDTTVVGDLSATGKLWGEGNRIYVPDYNTLNPGELNMQVGEIMTVYNDTVDINVSHGPWESSSAGYIIRNNSATPGTNNSVFTLMIHRSLETADFATRVWRNNKWNNWVIGGTGGTGGTGGSGSTKPSNIHYWDGKSSTITPSNLDLWKEVLEEVKKDKFSIVICSPSYLPNNTSSSTFVLTTVPGNGKTQVNSLVYASTIESTPSDGVRSYVTSRDYVTLTMTNNVLTKVSERVRNSTRSPKYVSTENYTGMVPFIPTEDYHPATKKYVDNKAQDIFYWDGKSSTTTPYNKELWKEILDKAKTKTVLVYSSNESSTSRQNKAVFVINPSDVGTTTKSYYGLASYSNGATTSNSGAYYYISYPKVTISYSGGSISSVGTLGIENRNSSKFLPTDGLNEYIPTENYHPATKKYVDSKVSSAVKSNDGSVLNWVTMTKAEFEAAKENDTIEDGTVINVLDDFEVGTGNFNIFYWDGQSSSTNSDNLYLWRSAIQAAEDYGCSMILEKDPGNSNPKGPIIYYFTKEDLPTSSVTIYSTCYKNTSGNIYTKGNVSNAELYRRSVALTFSNGVLSSVGASGNSILTAKSYLTTETLSTTYDGKYFIPLKSYQPVSKGYLETQIITTQKTSKTCELPTDIT